MQLSTAEKALYVKVVFYGPGLSGKTTNLETIHRLTDPAQAKPMVSLKTALDRTLFFDLLPFDLGSLYGLAIRLKLYTVPGQVQYDATRKQVLSGADGVVFVADSNPAQAEANKGMIRFLKNNLQDNGIDPETCPLVFQWNKRDLVNPLPQDVLQRDLNWRRVPAFEAVATKGQGVFETFREITVLTLERLASKAPGVRDRMQAEQVRERVEPLFASYGGLTGKKSSAGLLAAPVRISPALGGIAADSEARRSERETFTVDDLLMQSIRATLEVADQATGHVSQGDELKRLRRERQALVRLGQIAAAAQDGSALLRAALVCTLSALQLDSGSVLAFAGKELPMEPVASAGCPDDPLNAVIQPGLGSLATTLLGRQRPVLCLDPAGELLFGRTPPSLRRVRQLLAVPIGGGEAGNYLLAAYNENPARELSNDDLEFAGLAAITAGLALRGLPGIRSR